MNALWVYLLSPFILVGVLIAVLVLLAIAFVTCLVLSGAGSSSHRSSAKVKPFNPDGKPPFPESLPPVCPMAKILNGRDHEYDEHDDNDD
jgi:hypothetical protein